MFIFTISSAFSEEQQKEMNYLTDNYLSCYCVWFYDLHT